MLPCSCLTLRSVPAVAALLRVGSARDRGPAAGRLSGSVLGGTPGAAGCSSGISVVRPDSFLRFGADFQLLPSIFGGRAMQGVLGAVCSPARLSLYLPICVGVLQTHLPDVKTR